MSGGGGRDEGYAWVVLGVCWVLLVISGVIYYSIGVVSPVILQQMGEGVVKTSLVGSTLLSTLMLASPLAGLVTKVLGCRLAAMTAGVLLLVGMVSACFATSVNLLIVSYGFITGLGMALLDTASVDSLGNYFKRYLPLASGLMTTGGAVGLLMGGPVSRALLDMYGLAGMFLIFGGLGSHACVGGMMMRRPPGYQKETNHRKANPLLKKTETNGDTHKTCLEKVRVIIYSLSKLLCNGGFIVYVMSYSLWCLGESAIYVHLPLYAEKKGTDPAIAAMLFTTMGTTSLVGRMLAGVAGNHEAIGSYVLHTGLLGLAGLSLMLLPVMSATYTLQSLFACLYGLYSGGPYTLVTPILVDILGTEQLLSGFGILNFFGGIGFLLGPPLTAFIYSQSGSFDISFICSGGIILFGSIISLLVPPLVKQWRHPGVDEQHIELSVEPI